MDTPLLMDAPQPLPVIPGKPRVLDCPVCGGAITLRAVGHSVNAACTQCGSLLDVALAQVQVLQKAHAAQRPLRIPLGTRGRLDGIEWEAIGYQERSSGSDTRYSWEETLLFNPRHGFRFLAQAEGHWTLYRVIKSGMGLPAEARFARFFSGVARVDYVLGEFYWRVKVGDEVQVNDSVAPPYLLSVEKDQEEINISLGRWLPPEEVAAAFALDRALLPKPEGIAPNQPSPFAARVPGVLRTFLLAAALASAIQLIQAYAARNQTVHSEQFAVTALTRDEPRVSPPFLLEAGQANVCLESQAALSNDWAELDATLVNEASHERRSLRQDLAFYFGIDGGERWSEGSGRADACFDAVPGGQYRLILEADAGGLAAGPDKQQAFAVQLRRDVPIWSNWLALLLALLPYPLILWLRHHDFEYKRWAESDFLPETYARVKNALNGEEEA